MENKYPDLSASFEDDTSWFCYDDRFTCPTCSIIVCRRCVMNTRQGIVCAKIREEGIRVLTEDEVNYISYACGVNLKQIIDNDNYNELRQIPHVRFNNKTYYGYMRGTPGEDFPYKCPICRQLDNKTI